MRVTSFPLGLCRIASPVDQAIQNLNLRCDKLLDPAPLDQAQDLPHLQGMVNLKHNKGAVGRDIIQKTDQR